jgi:hypothetical protein
VHIDAAADRPPVGAYQQTARWIGGDLVDRLGQFSDQLAREQVQWRGIDTEHRQRSFPLDPYRAQLAGSTAGRLSRSIIPTRYDPLI